MKALLFFLLFIQISCIPKLVKPVYKFEGMMHNHEPGKCYYSLFSTKTIDGQQLRKVIIETHPPVFKDTITTYTYEELIPLSNNGGTSVSIPLNKPYKSFVSINFEELEYVIGDSGYAYCVKDIPIRSKSLKLDSITKDIKIKTRIIVKPSFISYTVVNKPPIKLNPNQQYIEFVSKSIEKEYVVGHVCGGRQLVSKIKHALIARGYKLDTNNKFGQKTKDALTDFQKKNNLAIGTLNYETLKKLGVK